MTARFEMVAPTCAIRHGEQQLANPTVQSVNVFETGRMNRRSMRLAFAFTDSSQSARDQLPPKLGWFD